MKKKRSRHGIQVQIRKRIEDNKTHEKIILGMLGNPRVAKHHSSYEQGLIKVRKRLAAVVNVAYKRMEKGDKRMTRILKRIGMA